MIAKVGVEDTYKGWRNHIVGHTRRKITMFYFLCGGVQSEDSRH